MKIILSIRKDLPIYVTLAKWLVLVLSFPTVSSAEEVVGCSGWPSNANQFHIESGPSLNSPVLIDVKHNFRAQDTDYILAWGHKIDWELHEGLNPTTIIETRSDELNVEGENTKGLTPRTPGFNFAVAKSGGYCTNRGFIAQERPTVSGNTSSDGSEVYNTPIPFYATGTIDNWATNSSLTYKWNFGDGTTSTEQNPTHNFAKAGTFDIYVTSNDGKFDSIPDFVDQIWVRGPAEPPFVTYEPGACSGSFRYVRLSWRRTGTSFTVQKKVGSSWSTIYNGTGTSVNAQFWGGDYATVRAKASDPTYGADSGWATSGYNVAACGGGGGDLP